MIVRSGRIQDVEDGLSEFPHVVLNQARVHDFYLDLMRRSAAKLEPHYGRRVVAVQPSAPVGDDGARRVRADDLDVGQVDGTTGAANDARAFCVGNAFANRILHLDFIVVSHHNDDCTLSAIRVGFHQFRNDREDLWVPAQNDGVIVFQHERASLAQTVELRLEAVVQHTDQCADDEDAANGDKQHHPAETGPRVAAHCARV